jgi:hypothetical protein
VAFHTGRTNEARNLLAQGLITAHELEAPEQIMYCLEIAAAIALSDSNGEDAALILGAAEKIRDDVTSTQMTPFETDMHDQTVAAVSAKLDPPQLAELWANGRALTVDQAVAHALQTIAVERTDASTQ